MILMTIGAMPIRRSGTIAKSATETIPMTDLTKVQELIGGLYAVLSEDADGHAWTDEAADVAQTITRALDEMESVQRIADEEIIANLDNDADYPLDTPMADEYGG